MKAGIAIDSWKLPIFKKHLEEAGYTFTTGAGITAGTLLLLVECDKRSRIVGIVEAAQAECRKENGQ